LSESGHTLLDRRLLLFTGKGGVGKSSVVAGLAAHCAAVGRRPLIVELGHRASMEAIFGVERVGYEPRPVGGGVWAMNVEFDSALRDYLAEHVRVKRLAKAIVNNDTLQRFFRAAPSVSEVATLNKISALEGARDDGRLRWDPVIVDLDATGHALMLLGLPGVMDGLIGDGPMRRLIDGFTSLLTDARRTVLNLVTLPKELPAQETVELYQRLRDEHDVALGALFINQVPAVPIAAGLASMIDDVDARARSAGHESVLEELEMGRRSLDSHRRALSQIARLRSDVDLPIVELPRLWEGVGAEQVSAFGALVASQLKAAGESFGAGHD
jgi:anion-transporting  ArsA/GET3 family ATPase